MKPTVIVLFFAALFSGAAAADRAQVAQMFDLYLQLGKAPARCVPDGDVELRKIADLFERMHVAAVEYQRSRLETLGPKASDITLRSDGSRHWTKLGFEVVVAKGAVPKAWKSDVAEAEKKFSAYFAQHPEVTRRWAEFIETNDCFRSVADPIYRELEELRHSFVPGYLADDEKA